MRTILEYLEKSKKRDENKIAVIDEHGKCTYKELMENSKKIGSEIAKKIETKRPVPVLMEKGINALNSFLGAVYANCFYVLLNPDLPQTRLEHIIEVLEPEIIITDEKNQELAKTIFKKEILLVEDLKNSEIDEELLANIRENILDIDPLYANFTSGSTGIPKGVVVSNHSVMDFIDNFTEIFNITEKDVIGNQAPFDFDVSVKYIYSALKTGATLVIIPKKYFSLPTELLDFICENKVTTMIWAVSALCLITTFHGLDYKTPETVNKVLFSGEVMPLKHLKQWIEHLPNAMFVNLYGPTEITCNCTYYIVDNNKQYEKTLPMGKPFPNEEVFLLDDQNKKIVEKGINGEICVRGVALALGYYNSREQTDSRFVQNPLNTKYNDYIYRTGDLAYYNENGEMCFAGRKDFQIKFMGHRIELEEIERAMEKVPQIDRSCCIFNEQKGRLYGFYVGNIEKAQVLEELRKDLPVFMIPNSIKQIEKFPMTKNGKIDRKELMEMIGGKKK